MDLLKLLEVLVEFNTVNDPDNGRMPDPGVVDFIEGVLNGLGIKTRVLVSHGYRSVVGGVVGSGKPRVLLLAHLDVVPFIRSEWRYDPLRLTVEGDLAYGRGTLDDKGNVAAVLKALEDLVSIGKGTVIAAFTTDEEVGSENGARVVRDYLLGNGLRPNYVINADGQLMVIINRRRAIFNARVRSRLRGPWLMGVRRPLGFNLIIRSRLHTTPRTSLAASIRTQSSPSHSTYGLTMLTWLVLGGVVLLRVMLRRPGLRLMWSSPAVAAHSRRLMWGGLRGSLRPYYR